MAVTMGLRLIVGFLVFVMVARYLGVVQFGIFMYWMTVSALVALLVGFGSAPYMLKEIGENPKNRQQIVGSVGASKFVLVAFVVLASIVATPWIGNATLVYWCLLFTALSEIISEYIFCAFRGMNDYLTEVWFSTVLSFVHLVLLFAAITADAGLVGIALTFMVSRAIAALVAGITYRRRFGEFGIRQNWSNWKSTLQKNKAYAADSFLTNIYSQLDNILLKHLAGPESLGIYQAGLRLMQGLNNISPVLSNVYLPKIAYDINHGNDHSPTAGLLYNQLVGFGLIVALGTLFLNEQIVNLLYGSQFEALKPLLPWFGVLLLLRLFASNFGILLTASGHQASRAWSVGACLIIIVISGVVLIPTYGALGMVWSALIATLVLAVTYWIKTALTQAKYRWGTIQIAISTVGFAVITTMLFRLNTLAFKS